MFLPSYQYPDTDHNPVPSFGREYRQYGYLTFKVKTGYLLDLEKRLVENRISTTSSEDAVCNFLADKEIVLASVSYPLWNIELWFNGTFARNNHWTNILRSIAHCLEDSDGQDILVGSANFAVKIKDGILVKVGEYGLLNDVQVEQFLFNYRGKKNRVRTSSQEPIVTSKIPASYYQFGTLALDIQPGKKSAVKNVLKKFSEHFPETSYTQVIERTGWRNFPYSSFLEVSFQGLDSKILYFEDILREILPYLNNSTKHHITLSNNLIRIVTEVQCYFDIVDGVIKYSNGVGPKLQPLTSSVPGVSVPPLAGNCPAPATLLAPIDTPMASPAASKSSETLLTKLTGEAKSDFQAAAWRVGVEKTLVLGQEKFVAALPATETGAMIGGLLSTDAGRHLFALLMGVGLSTMDHNDPRLLRLAEELRIYGMGYIFEIVAQVVGSIKDEVFKHLPAITDSTSFPK